MKGVYFVEGVAIERGHTGDGIERKVLYHIEQLEKISEVKVLNLPNITDSLDRVLFILPFPISKREKRRRALIAEAKDASFIYIRKPSLTIDFYKVLKTIKKCKPSIVIFMELPTFPFHKEYRGIAKAMALKSIYCENKLKSVVDRIITYSGDDEIWGIPTIRLSNSVDFKSIKIRDGKSLKDNTIRFTSVANFTYWHGLDRMIEGIANYHGKYNIVLNVVGEGREVPNLKEKAKALNVEKQVIFHGFKTGSELSEIFDNTDIAVDSLGRHRSGVIYNSSLKGKEYAARGIPSISGVKTEFDNIPDFQYYFRVPADDTPVDIEAVVAFYEKVYIQSGLSVEEISHSIREYTYQLFDYSNGFLPVIKQFRKMMED